MNTDTEELWERRRELSRQAIRELRLRVLSSEYRETDGEKIQELATRIHAARNEVYNQFDIVDDATKELIAALGLGNLLSLEWFVQDLNAKSFSADPNKLLSETELASKKINLGLLEKNDEYGWVYFLWNGAGELVYIGQSINVVQRLSAHYHKSATHISLLRVPRGLLSAVEYAYIKKFSPPLNTVGVPETVE